MTLTELSVYMKEQEQLRTEKEREEGEAQTHTHLLVSPVDGFSLPFLSYSLSLSLALTCLLFATFLSS